MTAILKNFIGGEWVDGSGVTRNINPSNTNDLVGEYAKADKAQTEKAIAAAKAAFPGWAQSTPQVRYDALNKISLEILARKEELGRLLAREEGKTLPEGIGEVARAGQIFAFFAGEALRLIGEKGASVRPGLDVELTREPMGVVGMITPWNFPIAIPAWKIAPALCYGNTVVFKPAELVPGSAHALSEIITRSGIPAGVFNLVVGSGSVVGQTLLDHPDVAAISFTGSVQTGRKIAQACVLSNPMKKFQLEMGGKNPLVVLDDADLKTAVEVAVNGSYFSTGQRCTASSRLIVTEGIHDRFVAAMAERLKGLSVDDALKAGVHIGPVVDQSQLDQDLRYIKIGQDEGAKLALRRRAAPARDARPLPPAGAVHRSQQQHAHCARRDLRPGRRRHSRQELRGSARDLERHRVRPRLRHLHHQPEIRLALQAQQRVRHGDGQPADRRRRLSRAVRRPEGLELRRPRAGLLCPRVLHDGEDRLYLSGLRHRRVGKAKRAHHLRSV
ncbi:acyl-CoA reductase-like NAD-dependent aldehyde dehydrogenase [Bradyrhizobium diazoefficiens]